eukprot:gene12675-15905_t
MASTASCVTAAQATFRGASISIATVHQELQELKSDIKELMETVMTRPPVVYYIQAGQPLPAATPVEPAPASLPVPFSAAMPAQLLEAFGSLAPHRPTEDPDSRRSEKECDILDQGGANTEASQLLDELRTGNPVQWDMSAGRADSLDPLSAYPSAITLVRHSWNEGSGSLCDLQQRYSSGELQQRYSSNELEKQYSPGELEKRCSSGELQERCSSESVVFAGVSSHSSGVSSPVSPFKAAALSLCAVLSAHLDSEHQTQSDDSRSDGEGVKARKHLAAGGLANGWSRADGQANTEVAMKSAMHDGSERLVRAAGKVDCVAPTRSQEACIIPACHLPRGACGPAVWVVSNENQLAEAVCKLMRDPVERESRGLAAAQGAAKLASGLVNNVWSVLDGAIIDPALHDYMKAHPPAVRSGVRNTEAPFATAIPLLRPANGHNSRAILSTAQIPACLLREMRSPMPQWLNRLGYSPDSRDAGPVIWFHLADLRDCSAALPVISRCLQEYNEKVGILVTVDSPEAFALVKRVLPTRVKVLTVPLDNPITARLFLRKWKPQVGVFLDSPFDTSLILAAAVHGVRLALLNAHLESKDLLSWHSQRSYRKLLSNILSCFSMIVPQSDKDVGNLRIYGATMEQMPGWSSDLEQVAALGSGLWHPRLPAEAVSELQNHLASRQTWLAVNVTAEEEATIIGVHALLKQQKGVKRLLTVLVPKSQERSIEFAGQIKMAGFSVELWSNQPLSYASDFLILDDPSELFRFYHACKVVYAGGLSPSPEACPSVSDIAAAAVSRCALLVGGNAAQEPLGSFVKSMNAAAIHASEEAAAAVMSTGHAMDNFLSAKTPQASGRNSHALDSNGHQVTSPSEMGSSQRRPLSLSRALNQVWEQCFNENLGRPSTAPAAGGSSGGAAAAAATFCTPGPGSAPQSHFGAIRWHNGQGFWCNSAEEVSGSGWASASRESPWPQSRRLCLPEAMDSPFWRREAMSEMPTPQDRQHGSLNLSRNVLTSDASTPCEPDNEPIPRMSGGSEDSTVDSMDCHLSDPSNLAGPVRFKRESFASWIGGGLSQRRTRSPGRNLKLTSPDSPGRHLKLSSPDSPSRLAVSSSPRARGRFSESSPTRSERSCAKLFRDVADSPDRAEEHDEVCIKPKSVHLSAIPRDLVELGAQSSASPGTTSPSELHDVPISPWGSAGGVGSMEGEELSMALGSSLNSPPSELMSANVAANNPDLGRDCSITLSPRMPPGAMSMDLGHGQSALDSPMLQERPSWMCLNEDGDLQSDNSMCLSESSPSQTMLCPSPLSSLHRSLSSPPDPSSPQKRISLSDDTAGDTGAGKVDTPHPRSLGMNMSAPAPVPDNAKADACRELDARSSYMSHLKEAAEAVVNDCPAKGVGKLPDCESDGAWLMGTSSSLGGTISMDTIVEPCSRPAAPKSRLSTTQVAHWIPAELSEESAVGSSDSYCPPCAEENWSEYYLGGPSLVDTPRSGMYNRSPMAINPEFDRPCPFRTDTIACSTHVSHSSTTVGDDAPEQRESLSSLMLADSGSEHRLDNSSSTLEDASLARDLAWTPGELFECIAGHGKDHNGSHDIRTPHASTSVMSSHTEGEDIPETPTSRKACNSYFSQDTYFDSPAPYMQSMDTVASVDGDINTQAPSSLVAAYSDDNGLSASSVSVPTPIGPPASANMQSPLGLPASAVSMLAPIKTSMPPWANKKSTLSPAKVSSTTAAGPDSTNTALVMLQEAEQQCPPSPENRIKAPKPFVCAPSTLPKQSPGSAKPPPHPVNGAAVAKDVTSAKDVMSTKDVTRDTSPASPRPSPAFSRLGRSSSVSSPPNIRIHLLEQRLQDAIASNPHAYPSGPISSRKSTPSPASHVSDAYTTSHVPPIS